MLKEYEYNDMLGINMILLRGCDRLLMFDS